MSDFLQRLLGRSKGTMALAQPALPARFEDVSVPFEEFIGREEGRPGVPPMRPVAAEPLVRARTQGSQYLPAERLPAERFPAEEGTTAQASLLTAVQAASGEPFQEDGRVRPHGPVLPLVPEPVQKQEDPREVQTVEARADGQGTAPVILLQASVVREPGVLPSAVLARKRADAAPLEHSSLALPKEPHAAGERAPLRVEAQRAAPADGARPQAARQDEDRSQAAIDIVQPIEVHIGRIEIVAPPPPPPEKVVRLRPPQPALGLTEYLERRGRGEM